MTRLGKYARGLVRIGALLLATGVVYLMTACPYVLGGDNGEFATLAATGGVAHPPGYPLYTIILRAFAWIPGSSPAHTAALATALIGVAGVAGVYRAARSWGGSRLSSISATGIYAFSSLAWTLSTHAEVFALNALIAALLVDVCGPESRIRGVPRSALIFFLLGAGLTNHHSIILLAPVIVFGAVMSVRETRSAFGPIGGGLVAFFVGLSPYFYTYVVAQGSAAWMWGEPSTFAGWIQHFTREDYGTTQLAITDGAEVSLVALLGDFFGDTLRVVLVVPALIALLGGRASARTAFHRLRAFRWGIRTVALSWLLAGPIFVSMFNLAPTGIADQVLHRFHLLPLVLMTVFVARGIDWLRELFPIRGDYLMTIVVAWLSIQAVTAFSEVRDHNRPTVELYIRNTVSMVPESSVILGTGDHRLFGMLYAQEAVGLRRDVVYVDVHMLRYPWYFQRIRQQIDAPLTPPRRDNVDTRQLARELLAAERTLYLTDVFSDAIVTAFPTYPIGTLIRVLPPEEPPPAPLEVARRNREVFRTFVIEDDPPRDRGTWAGALQATYARPWRMLAQIFEQSGMPDRAREAQLRADAVAPPPAE